MKHRPLRPNVRLNARRGRRQAAPAAAATQGA